MSNAWRTCSRSGLLKMSALNTCCPSRCAEEALDHTIKQTPPGEQAQRRITHHGSAAHAQRTRLNRDTVDPWDSGVPQKNAQIVQSQNVVHCRANKIYIAGERPQRLTIQASAKAVSWKRTEMAAEILAQSDDIVPWKRTPTNAPIFHCISKFQHAVSQNKAAREL